MPITLLHLIGKESQIQTKELDSNSNHEGRVLMVNLYQFIKVIK